MGKRESIKGKTKAWVVRGKDGKFVDWHNKKKSMRQDRLKDAANIVKPGYGHQGDQEKRFKNKAVGKMAGILS